jgi:hypothetical protein
VDLAGLVGEQVAQALQEALSRGLTTEAKLVAQVTTLIQESLQLMWAQQDEWVTAVALIGLAVVAIAGGDGPAARACLQERVALAKVVRGRETNVGERNFVGALLHNKGADLTLAARLLAFVWQILALTQEIWVLVKPLRLEMNDGGELRPLRGRRADVGGGDGWVGISSIGCSVIGVQCSNPMTEH